MKYPSIIIDNLPDFCQNEIGRCDLRDLERPIEEDGRAHGFIRHPRRSDPIKDNS
jgi:hypothetical protein